MQTYREKTIERFWSKVSRKGKDECWEWSGAKLIKDAVSHGMFGMENRRNKRRYTVLSHRFSWMLHNRDWSLTSASMICHTCDNPGCVNPSHLYKGNHQTNMKDRFERNRTNKGTRNGMAKLSEEQVRRIRRLDAEGIKRKVLSKLFCIVPQTISKICLKRRWIHI